MFNIGKWPKLKKIFSWTVVFVMLCNSFIFPVHAQENSEPEEVEVCFVSFKDSKKSEETLQKWTEKTEHILMEKYKTDKIHYNVLKEELLEDGTENVIDLEFQLQKEMKQYDSEKGAEEILKELKEQDQEEKLFGNREVPGKLVLILNDGQEEKFYDQKEVDKVLGENWNSTVDFFNQSYFTEENQMNAAEDSENPQEKSEEESSQTFQAEESPQTFQAEESPQTFQAAKGNSPLRYVRVEQQSANIYDDDYARVYYSVTEASNGTIEVYDANGKRMQILYDNVRHAPENYYMNWDLKDSSGNYVPEGTYTFRLTFDGSVEEVNVNVKAEAKPVLKNVRLLSNHVNVYEDNYARVYYSVAEASNGTIEVYDSKGKRMQILYDNVRHAPNNYYMNWDLKDSSGNYVPEGVYTFRLTFAGSVEEIKVNVKAEAKPVLKNVRLLSDHVNVYEDSYARVYYSVTEASNGTIEVYDSKGKRMQILYDNVRHAPNNYYMNWDLKDSNGNYVPEGVYTFRLTFAGSVEEIKVNVKAEARPVLKNVRLLSDHVNVYGDSYARVYYSVTSASNGTIEVYDSKGKRMQILYDNVRHAPNNYYMNWDLKDSNGNYVPEGIYTFRLTFGGSKEEIKVNVKAEAKPVLKNVRLLSNQVNIYEDSYARVYYSVTATSNGTIEVYDAKGKKMQTLYDNVRHAPENYYMNWDLKDSNGNYVPEGMYTFRLTFAGSVEEIKVNVKAEAKPVLKNVRLLSNQVNVYEDSYARVYYSVTSASNGTIEVYDAKGKKMQTLYDNVRHAPENYYMNWDLKDSSGNYVPEGMYTFRLTFGGSKEEVKVNVKAEARPVLKNVRLLSDQVNIYDDDYARVYYSVTEASNGTIEVYDAKGKKMQTLYDNVRHTPENYYMNWNLKDSSGNYVPDGVYTFRLTFGGSKEEIKVSVKSSVEITHTKIEPKEIVAGQETAAYYRINHNAVGTVGVYDASGKKVYDIYNNTPHIEGYYKVTWDGTDNNGNIVPAGKYTIRIAFGSSKKELTVVLKDRSLLDHVRMAKETANLYNNEAARSYYSVLYPSDGTIGVYDSTGNLVQTLYDNVRHVPENYYIDWDLKDSNGKKVKEGIYTVRFDFKSQGSKETQEVKVKVVNEVTDPIQLTNVHIERKTVNYSMDDAAIFYSVSKDCVGTLGVYNESGEKIYTIYDKTPHIGGYYRASWPLKTDKGETVKPGEYTFKLEVEADGIKKTAQESVTVKKSGDIPEMRAVNFSYLEWQKLLKGNTQQDFIKNVNTIVSNMKESDLNTIILHVRSHGDAYYPSSVYPWSANVTGSVGSNPGYDPLQIFIDQAHEKGIKVHAWINPYRLMKDAQMQQVPDNYKIKQWYQNPAYMAKDKNGYWILNPGNPEARSLVNEGAAELVNHYNLDGIYMDDYFYSEGIKPSTFNQSEQEARNSTTATVKGLYDTIKGINSNVLFGISPSGNYSKDIPNTDKYEYTDVVKWCKEPGYLDYIIPQIYWSRDHSSAPFGKMLENWEKLVAKGNVHLYVGVSAAEFAGQPELDEQIKIVNQSQWAEGYVLYRYENIANLGKPLQLSVEQPKEVSVSSNNAKIYYTVDKKSVGSIEVYNSQDELIQTIYKDVPHEAMRYVVTWNLCDEKGNKVTEGNYKIKFKFISDAVIRVAECTLTVGPEEPLVWIDAGHGGKDVGAVSNGRYERDDNLTIALEVQRVLEQQNVKVQMSRIDDDPSYISQGLKSLGERVDRANEANADIFVSLHRDSASASARGFTVYTHNAGDSNNANPNAVSDKNLGCVKLSTILEQQISEVGAFRSRGIKYGSASGSVDLFVNKHTNMPSCLLEMGFISNQDDNRAFDTYLKQNSKAIAKGIMMYLGMEFNENLYTAY